MSDKELDALKQLENAGLSAEGRRNVKALRAEIESREPEGIMRKTRRALAKIFKWIVVPGLALGGAVGATAYVVTQAKDAFPATLQSALEREPRERKEEIIRLGEAVKSAGVSMRDKLLEFAWTAGEQLTNPRELFKLSRQAFSGIWSDHEQAKHGDQSPDKTIAAIKAYVAGNAELSAKLAAVEVAYKELERYILNFDQLPKVLTEVTEEDERQFWADYRKNLWKEMLGMGEKMPTSAPASGSQE